jgi:hypothetical protein
MFFGCCGCTQPYYWIRKLADQQSVNVLAESDVERFQNTTDIDYLFHPDYPVPAYLTTKKSRVTVVSNNSNGRDLAQNATKWFRHIYNYDLDIIEWQTFERTAWFYYDNGECLVLATLSAATVYNSDASIKYTVTIAAGEEVQGVALDSSNGLYIATKQTSSGFGFSYITKFTDSGATQWKANLGIGLQGFYDMEIASDDYLYAVRSASLGIARIERWSLTGAVSFTSLGSAYSHILTAGASGEMWTGETPFGATIANIQRYNSSLTKTAGRFPTALSDIWDLAARDNAAIWIHGVGDRLLKMTSAGSQELLWYGYNPATIGISGLPYFFDGFGTNGRIAYGDNAVFAVSRRVKKQ